MPTGARIVPADHLPRWSRYAAMMRDWSYSGPGRGDGVLTRDELQGYIENLNRDRMELLRRGESTLTTDMRIRESREMLGDMDRSGVEGLAYLPPEIAVLGLRPELNARITEMLMTDDEAKLGRVSQAVVDSARGRYLGMEARSPGMLQVRERALLELNEIARTLGLI